MVYAGLGPPLLNVPSVDNPQVPVGGRGAPGATITIYQGNTAVGSTLTVDPSGNFSGVILLSLGNATLTAIQSLSGQTSANSPRFL